MFKLQYTVCKFLQITHTFLYILVHILYVFLLYLFHILFLSFLLHIFVFFVFLKFLTNWSSRSSRWFTFDNFYSEFAKFRRETIVQAWIYHKPRARKFSQTTDTFTPYVCIAVVISVLLGQFYVCTAADTHFRTYLSGEVGNQGETLDN